MLSRFRTALKFMTYGLLIGIFFAPDRGDETRRKVINWATSNFRQVVGNVTGDNSN
jgi:hypothetical protein